MIPICDLHAPVASFFYSLQNPIENFDVLIEVSSSAARLRPVCSRHGAASATAQVNDYQATHGSDRLHSRLLNTRPFHWLVATRWTGFRSAQNRHKGYVSPINATGARDSAASEPCSITVPKDLEKFGGRHGY